MVVIGNRHPAVLVASEAAASIGEYCFDDLKAPVRRVTRENVPVPFSPPMEKHILLNPDKVLDACRSILTLEHSV